MLPLPISPIRTAEPPIANRISFTDSKTSGLPPTIMDIVPSMALGSPPLTGASSISTSFSAAALYIFFATTGDMELMSIMMLPGLTV
ncbi:MAG: hypothetical protein BWY95_01927 [Bacteroidetes bacterium ADurb.BinA104]|nr:MAG: hypothetical protein BWY95_01927 [Bacteroidetes bacterium ADurb.BinA104]